MKYLYLDVETTGIDHRENAIIQIAALLTQEDGEIQDRIILDIAPFPDAKIEVDALAVNGKTLEQIQAYPKGEEQLKKFTEFLQKYVSPYDKKDKLLLLAYNATFDADFLRAFFTFHGNNFFGSYFWNPPIDIMTLAMQALKEKRADMLNFKLATVAKFLGITVSDDQLHDAYYDILLAHQVYHAIFPPSAPVSKEEEKVLPFSEEEFRDSLF